MEGGGQPEFGRSVNPIQNRGADCAPHTTARIQKAIYTSAFGLVSALVFSVQNDLGPTVIWLI